MNFNFSLTTQAGRAALLLAVIDTMRGVVIPTPVKSQDIEAALEQDVEGRPYRKPCVVEDKVFGSVTEAAHYLAWHRRDLWENSKAAQRMDAYGVMNNLRGHIKRRCDGDETYGYYWI